MPPLLLPSVPPGLISVNSVQHGSSQLQVPAEFQQVHDAMVHLLQDPLQPETNTDGTLVCSVMNSETQRVGLFHLIGF